MATRGFINLDHLLDWVYEHPGFDGKRLGVLLAGPDGGGSGKFDALAAYAVARALRVSVIRGGFPLVVSPTANAGGAGILVIDGISNFDDRAVLDLLNSLPADWMLVATAESTAEAGKNVFPRLIPIAH